MPSVQFSSVPSLSCVRLFATPWIAARQASLSITNSRSSLRLMSIESVMPSSHLILCRPLLLLPSIFPSIRVFSNESALRIRWPKYWSFSFNISPSNEHPGLISFRMDWLDLLAVQGTPYIYNCYIFFLDWSFDHYVVSFFVSFHSLYFKVYFMWYEYWYSSLLSFGLHLHEIPFFQPFTFSLYVLCVCVYIYIYTHTHTHIYVQADFSGRLRI